MFGVRTFAVGLLMGLSSGIFITHFHVVRTNDGFDVVPRVNQPPLRSTYCDVREWSTAMWTNYPEVTAALTKSGRSQVIGQNLKENLLEEILPQAPARRSAPAKESSVARRPVPVHTESGDLESVETEMAAGNEKISNQWLNQKSPLRQKWESIVDDAVAPIVDEAPAVEPEPSEQVLPQPAANDPMIRKLEERFRNAKPMKPRPEPAKEEPVSETETVEVEPDGVEAVEEVARDFLQQVIPQGSQIPKSVAPLRDLGELLNAPAPAKR